MMLALFDWYGVIRPLVSITLLLFFGWQVVITCKAGRKYWRRLAFLLFLLLSNVLFGISEALGIIGYLLQFPLGVVMGTALIVMWLRGSLVLKRQ